MTVPVVVKFATRLVRGVPNGRVTAMVLDASFTVPGEPGKPTKENAVMGLAKFEATVTFTVYLDVGESATVTVYTTGPVKLFAVDPLVCATVPTDTPVPVVVYVATNAVKSVPYGMLTAMVWFDSLIVPATPLSVYAVINGALFQLPPPATPPPLPPQPGRIIKTLIMNISTR
jgi:hypothetical protein